MMGNGRDAVGVLGVGCGLVVVGALLTGGCVAGKAVTVSEGFRDGVVQKLSKRGLFIKTWEGELALDRVKVRAGEHGASGGTVVFKFSVADDALAEQLLAVPPNRPVRLTYRQRLTTTPFDYESTYLLTKVEPLHD